MMTWMKHFINIKINNKSDGKSSDILNRSRF